MKLAIEPTKRIAIINGVPARVWVAQYDGVQVQVLVTGVGLEVEAPPSVHQHFAEEMQELVGGAISWMTDEGAADDVDVAPISVLPVSEWERTTKDERCAHCHEHVHNRANYHQCHVDIGQVPFAAVPRKT